MHYLHTELTQRKKGSIVAADDVTFQIEKGETLGLVGGSGCGRSVTALPTMDLLKDTSGKIMDREAYPEGNDLPRCSEEEIRKIQGENVSMIFQEAMLPLNPAMRINAQLVKVIFLHMDKTKYEVEEHIPRVLGWVGILDPARVGRSHPYQLSGGMSRRMMIAVTMSCDPYLLIADELTTTLDVTIQVQILDLTWKIQREICTGTLSITHDLGVVAEMCSRVIVMYAGRIAEEAPVQHLFYEPIRPYTEGLTVSVSKFDSGVMSLPSIPGSVPDLSMTSPGRKFAPRCRYTQDRCREEEPLFMGLNEGRKCRCVLVQDKEAAVE